VETGDRATLSTSASIVAACAVYLANPRTPVYYPLQHAFRFETSSEIGMAWYGRSACAVLAGAAVFALGALVTKRITAVQPWLRGAATWVALGALIASLGHLAWHEYATWMR
jgi:hypothetical protein